MSAKRSGTAPAPAGIRQLDDLEGQIRKGARRQRIFSLIVLALLLTAFGVSSAMSALPALWNRRSDSGTPAAPTAQDLGGQIHALQALVRLHPKDEDMLLSLADDQFDSRQFHAASVTYRQVLALDPGNPDVRTDYGTSLYYQHEPMEAIAAFEKVLQTHPRFVKAMTNLGVVYDSMGQQNLAAQEWHSAYQEATDPKVKAKVATLLEGLLSPS